MVKINNHIKKIVDKEIKNKNPKIRLYRQVESGVCSYTFENNEGYIGNKTNKDLEKEVLDKSYKGITIIINN